jgi:outer membrane lipoprotein-sorting protein
MKPADKIKELINKSDVTTDSEADKRILGEALEHLEKLKKKKLATTQPNIWRTIMKSRITKLAAAAAIVIIGLWMMNHFGVRVDRSSSAFAEIIQPLLDVKTGRFSITTQIKGGPGQTTEVVFSEPGRTRLVCGDGKIIVADMGAGEVMVCDAVSNKAMIMEVSGDGSVPQNRFNVLLGIRELLQEACSGSKESVESLGEAEVDGVAVAGYRVTDGDVTVTVWAQEGTNLPFSVELSVGSMREMVTHIISNIDYDVVVDESLFSLVPPVEYELTVVSGDDMAAPMLITGIVRDAETGQVIAGANVSDDGYGPKPYKSSMTDSAGRFSYSTWHEEHAILAEAPGYKSQSKTITAEQFQSDKFAVINFSLEKQ